MIVGLTGGIASGKTTVSRLFEILGASVFLSDVAARESYFDGELKKKIVVLLGNQAYISDREINRKFISSILFNDRLLREKMNALIHPHVGKMFARFVTENPNRLIIKESALLFEAKISDQCDKVIVVAADQKLRVNRIRERDNISREQAEVRINSQIPQEDKIKLADFVIYNNENALLIPQVIALYEKLTLKNDT